MSIESIKRVGILATKIGMSQIFDDAGNAVPVTLLKVDTNTVIANKTIEKNGYNAVVLGYGESKANRRSKAIRGMCTKIGVPTVAYMKEFRVSADCVNLEVGKQLSINHVSRGQLVDVSAISVGKGFAGVMKRHNFSGGRASHGVSLSHRSHGSTGQCQDAGKVFKNKKMAGHMGDVMVTVQNIKVVAIDEDLGVIALHGAVPGSKGTVVAISDAIKKSAPVGDIFPAVFAEAK
jgi:large subunit ribosomal protein L3